MGSFAYWAIGLLFFHRSARINKLTLACLFPPYFWSSKFQRCSAPTIHTYPASIYCILHFNTVVYTVEALLLLSGVYEACNLMPRASPQSSKQAGRRPGSPSIQRSLAASLSYTAPCCCVSWKICQCPQICRDWKTLHTRIATRDPLYRCRSPYKFILTVQTIFSPSLFLITLPDKSRPTHTKINRLLVFWKAEDVIRDTLYLYKDSGGPLCVAVSILEAEIQPMWPGILINVYRNWHKFYSRSQSTGRLLCINSGNLFVNVKRRENSPSIAACMVYICLSILSCKVSDWSDQRQWFVWFLKCPVNLRQTLPATNSHSAHLVQTPFFCIIWEKNNPKTVLSSGVW